MTIYEDIYNFDIDAEVIKNPTKVFLVDREEKTVSRVADCDYLYILCALHDRNNRFSFYKEVAEHDDI